jgi:hypothetical protein
MILHKILVVLSVIFLPVSVWAVGMDDFETGHILSIGGGVSSPSVTSSLGENPAGLAYNHQTKLLGALAGANSSFNPMGTGGLFFLGNGYVGGGLGVQSFSSQRSDNNTSSITLFTYGIAAYITGLNISFGASGSYAFQGGGNAGGTGASTPWGLDLGLIYNPKGEVRFGASAFNVVNGVNTIGVGIAADASTYATFALDATADQNINGKTIKPAMGIHLMDFQFTLGYGVRLDEVASNWIRQGGSFGLGLRLTPMIHLQGYYNHIAQYYGALTIRL